MLFSEPFFTFWFLPVLLVIYYISPQKARNVILSIASLAFYAMGEWRFLGWLLASIAVNYWIARAIGFTRGTPWAKRLLIIGIISDLALLLIFKYAGFFANNVNSLLGMLHFSALPVPNLLLPLGISFFTFHKISYKVDVYRGTAEARKAPLDLALYILFFPQLIAGPIVRYHEIANEIITRTVKRQDFAEGIRRFVLGLGKKMIIANTVAFAADKIFAIPPHQLTPSTAWLGLACYTFQIYFDFSGYSDMAIGLARMFGFHFPENFSYPYIAQSVTEFWRRWHMTLSRFFRDYVYIPLGGNRMSPRRTYFNLVTIFFLCGLWHGASWNFVLWGLWHGMLLVLERVGLGKFLERTFRPLRHAYTLFMVMIGWVFFRADTLPQAMHYLASLFGIAKVTHPASFPLALYLNIELFVVLIAAIIGSMPVRPFLNNWVCNGLERFAMPLRKRLEYAGGLAGLLWIFAIMIYSFSLMAADTYNPFIYFRF